MVILGYKRNLEFSAPLSGLWEVDYCYKEKPALVAGCWVVRRLRFC